MAGKKLSEEALGKIRQERNSRQKQPNLKHGAAQYKKSGVLPKHRRYLKKQLDYFKNELIKDLGGEENLSAQKKALINNTALLQGVIFLIGEHVIKEAGVFSAPGQLQPCLGKSMIAYINSLRLNLQTLGIEARRAPVYTQEETEKESDTPGEDEEEKEERAFFKVLAQLWDEATKENSESPSLEDFGKKIIEESERIFARKEYPEYEPETYIEMIADSIRKGEGEERLCELADNMRLIKKMGLEDGVKIIRQIEYERWEKECEEEEEEN